MGQHFRAFVGTAAVPEAVSCSVSITGDVEDSSTKDTENAWTNEQMTSKGWSVQVDNLDASLPSLRALIAQFNADAKVSVGWDQTAGAKNRVAQNAPFAKAGQAILNDLSIQANNRTNIQVSAQYQGSGPLA